MSQEDNAPWQYRPDDDGGPEPDEPETGPRHRPHRKPHAEVSWQAAEFIEHHHGPGWYAGLIIATAALAALVFLITRDYFATGIIIVAGIIVWVFAGHKPTKADYQISGAGLSINGKNYPYGSYKSFSVMREGALNSINLIPLKRFMPPVAAYFEPKDEARITEALGEHLPLEDRKMDAVDRLSRRLRL